MTRALRHQSALGPLRIATRRARRPLAQSYDRTFTASAASCSAARALQSTMNSALLTAQTGRVHRHAAGVVATVFQPLQALHEDGNDVAGRNGADDATHKEHS